jgi:hypothetical protein
VSDLMGNAHEDVLTTFETTLKTIYRHLVRQRLPAEHDALCRKQSISNAFQNIERSSEKFARLDIYPFAGLTADDLSYLGLNIQKRHVIGHTSGLLMSISLSSPNRTSREKPSASSARRLCGSVRSASLW